MMPRRLDLPGAKWTAARGSLLALASGLLLLGSSGCSELTIIAPDPLEPDEVVWASELGIRLSDFEERESGLWVRVDEEPDADDDRRSSDGDRLSLEFDAWLPNGFRFESTQLQGPFNITLGEDLLIQGFEEGVTGMGVGEVRMLLIPPRLGFGPRSSGQIPPNSWLAFQVELVSLARF